MACAEHGLPIVSTLPAGAEVADAIRAVDPSGLVEAVQEVVADPEPWRARSKALAERVCWSRIAAAHLDIYDQVMQRLR